MIGDGEHVVQYVDDLLHDLLDDNDALYVQTHAERCPICRLAMEEAQRRFELLRGMPGAEPSAQLIGQTVERVRHASRRPSLRRIAWGSFGGLMAAAILIVALLNLHYLFLSPSPYDLKVVAQPAMMPGTIASVRALLTRRDTGAAVADAPVRIALLEAGKPQPVQLASFTTDRNGTGEPRFTLPDCPDGNYQLQISTDAGGNSQTVNVPVELHRSWKLMLSSDKPVYQPGQVMHFRALALREPDLHPVAGQSAVFTIADPKGDVLFKSTGVTSQFGIAFTDCPLATEILEGDYAVSCKVGDTESRKTVEIKRYVLPKFRIDIHPDQSFYGPGDFVHAPIHVAYFFGKAVVHGVVDASTTVGTSVERQTLITDDQGNTFLRYRVPETSAGFPQGNEAPRLAIHLTVHDSAGQEQEKTVERPISATPLNIELIPDSGQLSPGVANTIYVLTTYPDGSPASAHVAISGIDHELQTGKLGVASFTLTPAGDSVSLTVSAHDDNDRAASRHFTLDCRRPDGAADFALRTDKSVYRGGESMTIAALGAGTAPVFIDLIKDGQTLLTQTLPLSQGRGSATIDFPPDVFGTLTVDAYHIDSNDVTARQSRIIYVEPADQLKVSIAPDRGEYRPGDQAKLRLSLTDPAGKPAPGAISLAAVDESVFSVLEQQPGMEKTFFTLEQSLLKPIAAIYGWSPDTTPAAAGGQRSELEQALFSHAAEEIREHPLLPENNGWYGFPGKESRLQSGYDQQAISAVFLRRSALDALTKGWVAIVVILIIAGLVKLAEDGNYARAISVALFLALIVVVPLIAALANGVDLFGRSAWEPSSNLHQIGIAQGVYSEMRADGPVFSPILDPALTDAAPSPVPNAPRPAVAPRGGAEISSPASRVRQWFPETLLWRPEVITDAAGHAELDVDLADSITNWRLSASAVDAGGRLGAAQSDLRVFQPFFVDMNLPVALTRGDEISLPVVVYSYSDRPQAVTVSLDSKGPWLTLLDAPTKRLNLNAGQVASVWFRMRATGIGFHDLQVTARGNGVADAEKRRIEVVAPGPMVEKTFNGSLDSPVRQTVTLPTDAIPGSGSLVLKIYPTTFSQVVDGLDGIFQRPYGCFEQTSSTTYPNVLALTYLRQTGKSVPEVEAKAREYINLGYQRLVSFEVPGGGFDWFGHPDANPVLTAYGLMEFQDMAKVSDVDPNLIERTRNWLLSRRQVDGSWNAPRMLHDGLDSAVLRGGDPNLATTAYIAWAIYGGNPHRDDVGPTLDYLRQQNLAAIDDPYVLAVLANALEAIDPQGPQTSAAIDRLVQVAQTSADGKQASWSQPAGGQTEFFGSGDAGTVETTALAAIALENAHRSPQLVREALAWLIAKKESSGAWPSTQATVLALKALVAGTDKLLGSPADRTIHLTLGDGFTQEITIPADQAEVVRQIDLSAHLRPGENAITLAESTGTGSGYQLDLGYHVPVYAPAEHPPLSIDINYDKTHLAVGDSITTTATVTNHLATAAPMVLIDLPIPPGFSADAAEFQAMLDKSQIAKYQMTPRSVIIYVRALDSAQALVLTYHLKATMPAKITVAPAEVYEYYNPANRAESAPASLEAKPAA